MAEQLPRTLIDMSQLFAHGPASRTRSKMPAPGADNNPGLPPTAMVETDVSEQLITFGRPHSPANAHPSAVYSQVLDDFQDQSEITSDQHGARNSTNTSSEQMSPEDDGTIYQHQEVIGRNDSPVEQLTEHQNSFSDNEADPPSHIWQGQPINASPIFDQNAPHSPFHRSPDIEAAPHLSGNEHSPDRPDVGRISRHDSPFTPSPHVFRRLPPPRSASANANHMRGPRSNSFRHPLIPLPLTIHHSDSPGHPTSGTNSDVSLLDMPIPFHSDLDRQSNNRVTDGHYVHRSRPISSAGARLQTIAPVMTSTTNNDMLPSTSIPPRSTTLDLATQTEGIDNHPVQATLPSTQTNRKQSSSTGLFCPAPFNGTSCPRSWVRELRLWMDFQDMSENEKRIAAFALLLKDTPSVWFRSLKSSDTTDFEHLMDIFIERFNLDKKIWSRTATLWQMKQKPHQTVAEYIAQVVVQADQLEVDQKNTFLIAVNGLLPHLRAMVLLKEPTSIEDLLKISSLIETANESEILPYADISQSLLDLKQQLSKINSTLATPVQPVGDQKKVTFQIPADNPGACATDAFWSTRGDTRHAPPPLWDEPYDLPARDDQRPGNPYPNNQAAFHNPRITPRGRGFTQAFNRQYRPPQRYASQPLPPRTRPGCFNCGTSHAFGNCRAYRSRCERCFRMGHFSHMCRTNPYPPQ